MQQLKAKNKKIHKLKPKEQHIPYQAPIMSSITLVGLPRSFIDKNKFVKRDLGIIGRK